MSMPLFSLILALWIVFTCLFAYLFVYRDFSQAERDEFLKRYNMWMQSSPVAPLADPPAIIRRLQAFWRPFLEVVLVFFVNAAVPYLLFSYFESGTAYWLTMGLAFVELVGTIAMRRLVWVPQYRADFEHFLTLSAPGNQCHEGELAEYDPSRPVNPALGQFESDRFVNGGRIIALEFPDSCADLPESVPLFCPRAFGSLPEKQALRIFYRPVKEPIEGRLVVGVLVGWQKLPEPEEDIADSQPISLGSEHYEQRLAEKGWN